MTTIARLLAALACITAYRWLRLLAAVTGSHVLARAALACRAAALAVLAVPL